MSNLKAIFSGVKDGDTFRIGNMEFIKFPDSGGTTPVVAKDNLFFSTFGSNNDFRKSHILKRLEEAVFPKIAEVVGEDAICIHQVDLTSLDGLTAYGKMESRISIPTLDFYRENREIFRKYPVCECSWLATPDSVPPVSERWVLCVSPSGHFDYGYYYDDDCGVRPFLSFKSSIFESSEN